MASTTPGSFSPPGRCQPSAADRRAPPLQRLGPDPLSPGALTWRRAGGTVHAPATQVNCPQSQDFNHAKRLAGRTVVTTRQPFGQIISGRCTSAEDARIPRRRRSPVSPGRCWRPAWPPVRSCGYECEWHAQHHGHCGCASRPADPLVSQNRAHPPLPAPAPALTSRSSRNPGGAPASGLGRRAAGPVAHRRS
jgi:hypothetical protein